MHILRYKYICIELSIDIYYIFSAKIIENIWNKLRTKAWQRKKKKQ